MFRPNCFGRFESNIRIGCKLGLLDVNPNLCLARELQPPHIYLRGDGRLNNTNRTNTSIYFSCSSIPLPCTLLLVLRCSSGLEATIHEAPGAFRTTWSSQSSPGPPTGSLPRNRGVWSQKAPAGLSCVPRCRQASHDASCGASPSAPRVHEDLFVCQHYL